MHGDCCEPPVEFMGMWVTSVQEFRRLLWSTYLDVSEDTEFPAWLLVVNTSAGGGGCLQGHCNQLRV